MVTYKKGFIRVILRVVPLERRRPPFAEAEAEAGAGPSATLGVLTC